MKISSNIPIIVILAIFVASNTLLYRYLNNDYFVDKKSTVEIDEVDSVIFKLIADHEEILQQRNAEILSEAERLRNQKEKTTDSEELKAIEAKLRALEEEARRVQERVKDSEYERNIAARQMESDLLQLSELMESNSRMGAQLEDVTNEFEHYVSTLEETVVSNSSSDLEKNSINEAFNNKRGLNYLTDLVGNIQGNRTALTQKYVNEMRSRSNDYNRGLKEIANLVDDTGYSGVIGTNGLIDPTKSIKTLKDRVTNFLINSDNFNSKNLGLKLKEQEEYYLEEMNRQLNALRDSENLKLQEALKKLKESDDAARVAELLEAEKEKNLRLEELEKRLREELGSRKEIVPTADIPLFTSWIHIPGLWDSTKSSISYSGKKIDSIAWSRQELKDNQTISFQGDFDTNGEIVLILYGNGRFKSWIDGTVITLTDLNGRSGLLKITKNGIGDSSEILLENNVPLDSGLNGDYYLHITNGNLGFEINGKKIVKDYTIETPLTGRLGFGNRGPNKKKFDISNIKIFKIQ